MMLTEEIRLELIERDLTRTICGYYELPHFLKVQIDVDTGKIKE